MMESWRQGKKLACPRSRNERPDWLLCCDTKASAVVRIGTVDDVAPFLLELSGF